MHPNLDRFQSQINLASEKADLTRKCCDTIRDYMTSRKKEKIGKDEYEVLNHGILTALSLNKECRKAIKIYKKMSGDLC